MGASRPFRVCACSRANLAFSSVVCSVATNALITHKLVSSTSAAESVEVTVDKALTYISRPKPVSALLIEAYCQSSLLTCKACQHEPHQDMAWWSIRHPPCNRVVNCLALSLLKHHADLYGLSAASDPFKGVFGSMDMSTAMVPQPGGTSGPAPLDLDLLLGPNSGAPGAPQGFPKQPSAQGEKRPKCSSCRPDAYKLSFAPGWEWQVEG